MTVTGDTLRVPVPPKGSAQSGLVPSPNKSPGSPQREVIAVECSGIVEGYEFPGLKRLCWGPDPVL